MSLPSLPPAALDQTQLPPENAAWKDEISARLRSHRTRRARAVENQPALPGMEAAVSASSIAARVAERYARVPSYKDALAAQAAAAAKAAAAQAEFAAKAAAVAEAALAAFQEEPAAPVPESVPPPPPHIEPEPQPYQPDLLRYFVSADSLPTPRFTPAQAHAESVAHRRPAISDVVDPLEEAVVEPDLPLPARVIEFPRELVAPRKARPRIAEGPLLAEDAARPDLPPAAPDPVAEDARQIRIFEAPPEPSPESAAAAPQPQGSGWLSIRLDPDPLSREPRPSSRSSLLDDMPLHVAPIADRVMASVVDVALTLAAFLAFVLVFAACTPHLPTGRIALAGAAATLLATWALYQFLFFTLSAATPGMRYAKIALCTFHDDNPSRHAMRARIPALLLSALPLGLGFLWILFDEDALSWHDRITQTYQRSYRQM